MVERVAPFGSGGGSSEGFEGLDGFAAAVGCGPLATGAGGFVVRASLEAASSTMGEPHPSHIHSMRPCASAFLARLAGRSIT
jgi:hypothetical protein